MSTTPVSPTPGPLPASVQAPLTPLPTTGSRSPVLGCFLAISMLGNVVGGLLVVVLCLGLVFKSSISSDPIDSLPEKFHSGSRTSSDRVAILTLDGVIMEGMLGHVHKQLEQAGKDNGIKAVVLRINSPGGSITASDDLYRRIRRLRDGDPERKIAARPVVVSMGSVAASGGYFIAAPANKILAERSTMTGSIGVYATFPNVEKLAAKHGVTVEILKAGKIKDSGSLFREMTPVEKQVLQDMVDDAYVQFLQVIEKGRPKLNRQVMLRRFEVQPLRPDPQAADKVPAVAYQRYRADGGVFTATRALELGLIDGLGDLDDAVKAAASAAELDVYRAFRYQKPRSVTDILLGAQSGTPPAGSLLDPEQLRRALTPRVWYLAPGYEASGMFAPESN